MHGLMNRAVRECVLQTGGETAWTSVCEQARVTADHFRQTEQYPDILTYRIMTTAADALSMTPDDFLRAVGESWMTYVIEAGLGGVFPVRGRTFSEAVMDLERLHGRIRFGLPNMRPPSLRVRFESNGSLTVLYRSDRQGLVPLLVGMLYGLARLCGERIVVTPVPTLSPTALHELQVVLHGPDSDT